MNSTILLQLISWVNNYPIHVSLLSFLISLPIFIFIFDGFKLSENKRINKWQIINFYFLIFIFVLLLFLTFFMTELFNSDGKEDPHKKVVQLIGEGLKGLGDKLGDGGAAAAGLAGMAKLIPKNAPLALKAVSLGAGAAAGVLGKRGGQAASKVLFDDSKGKNDGSSSTNIDNITANNLNNSDVTNQNLMDLNFDWSTNINLIINKSELFTNSMLLSPNEKSILSLIFSDNQLEVLVSCILGLNFIIFIMTLLLIICLISYYLSNQQFELKWTKNFISDSSRLNIIYYLNKISKFYTKSLKINLIIIILVLLFCNIISISLLITYIDNLETFSNYYLNYIKK